MDDFCDRAWKAYEDCRLSAELHNATVFVRNSRRAFHLARKQVAETKKCASVSPAAYRRYLVSLETYKNAETTLVDAKKYKDWIDAKYEALWR